jgi:hypothetical protein
MQYVWYLTGTNYGTDVKLSCKLLLFNNGNLYGTYLLTFPDFTNLQAFLNASQMLKVHINIDPDPNTEKQSPKVN